jgi:hypothetical protein
LHLNYSKHQADVAPRSPVVKRDCHNRAAAGEGFPILKHRTTARLAMNLKLLKRLPHLRNPLLFAGMSACRDRKCVHEKLRENPIFDSGGSGLHSGLCGRQAKLQKERQELSHEPQ